MKSHFVLLWQQLFKLKRMNPAAALDSSRGVSCQLFKINNLVYSLFLSARCLSAFRSLFSTFYVTPTFWGCVFILPFMFLGPLVPLSSSVTTWKIYYSCLFLSPLPFSAIVFMSIIVSHSCLHRYASAGVFISGRHALSRWDYFCRPHHVSQTFHSFFSA